MGCLHPLRLMQVSGRAMNPSSFEFMLPRTSTFSGLLHSSSSYGLYKDMFRRGIQDRIKHAVIFDEAHRAANLTLLPTMAKECRKYRISLVVASQEAKDFNVSLFSAIANYLVFRVTESDAMALVRNVATSNQERALSDKLKQLDRFTALYFSEGKSRPALVRMFS